jgi:arogenate dehydrogenase (NADP+)
VIETIYREIGMRIGIVGLGLIGGSIGLDLCRHGYEVWGVSQRQSTCDRAIDRQAVTCASTDLASLRAAQVIFLCTPIGLIEPTVRQLIPHLSPETILTDVASVKRVIVETIAPLWPNFVGGHPMAGTAESGIEAALDELFVGNPYVLTPIASTPPEAVKVLEGLVKILGANLLHCDPVAHDRSVAWISHLPVMTSASLIAACQAETDPGVFALAQSLASSGFRDTSRVGGGNPELGLMMAKYNQPALLAALGQYRQQLDQIIDQIATADWAALEALLTQTQAARPPFIQD